MARQLKRVSRREQLRRQSRRWPKRIGIGLLILIPLLYFGFTKLFFDPFEAAQPPFSTLVPREVDVFVRREGLAADFTLDGRPAVWDRLQRSPAFRQVSGTDFWAALSWPAAIDEAVADLAEARERLPLDPLQDLLGREAVLIGRYVEGEPAPRLAALLRLTDRAKLAVAGLELQAGLSKAFPGATLATVEDPEVPGLNWRAVELPAHPDLPEGAAGRWAFARRTDLLVVSRDDQLVRDVLRTQRSGPESSLGLTRLVLDRQPRAFESPRGVLAPMSLDFVLQPQRLLPASVAPSASPTAPESAPPAAAEGEDSRSRHALANLLAALFDTRRLGATVGRAELGDTLRLRARGDLLSPSAAVVAAGRGTRHGVQGAPSFSVRDRLTKRMSLLPDDTSALITVNVDLRSLLESLVASLDPAFVALLNETLRNLSRATPSWRVENVHALVAYLERMFEGDITLALRPLDHQVPPGAQPLPLLAFLIPVRDVSLWHAMDDAVVRGWRDLGLDKDRMMKVPEGVGERRWLGVTNLPMEEFAYIVLDREMAVIATDNDFVREIIDVYTNARSSLAGRPEVRDLIASFAPDARGNLAAWASAEQVRRLADPYAEWLADHDTTPDLGVLRAQSRNDLVARDYRTWIGRVDEMPAEQKARLEEQLDTLIAGLESRRLSETVPALAAAARQAWSWLSLFRQGAVSLRLGEHDSELELHAVTVTAPAGR